MTHLLENYNRLDFALMDGKECHLIDHTGKSYLDLTSGIGVMNMGYSFEAGKAAVNYQLDHLAHLSNLYINPLQEKVAEKLSANGNYKSFFCNSGTEANEAALKLARLIRPNKKILAFKNGFHGRTFGAMSATMQPKIQKGFSPLVPDFVSCHFNDVFDFETQLKKEEIGAIIFEIIQGEGGILVIHPDFVAALKKAQKNGILLIVDEVQTGIGRTGKRFAFEHFDLKPDLITSAKALANGLPVGVMLAKNKYASYFSAGKHGSTFGGNPLAMASADAVLSHLTEDFLAEVEEKSDYFYRLLSEQLNHHPQVLAIRGMGLMLGIQLDDSCDRAEMMARLREKGVLVLSAGKNVIRLLPPLVIKKSELKQASEILGEVL